MKFRWSEDGYEREVKFGKGVVGMIHAGRRPDQVIFTAEDFREIHRHEDCLLYLLRNVGPVLRG